MQTAMHIGVVVLVVTAKCIEHPSRFLRGRSVVEVDQRLAVRLFMEDRKILTDSLPIDLCSSRLVHGLICPVPYRMPIYSGTPLQTPVQSHTAGETREARARNSDFAFALRHRLLAIVKFLPIPIQFVVILNYLPIGISVFPKGLIWA